MRVLFISEGPNGCGLYRVEIPLRYLPGHGIEGRMTHVHCSDEELMWADVLVVQKQFEMSFYQRLEKAKRAGKKIIYELDDDVFNLPSWNPAYPFYQRIKPNVIRFLKLADACTASTDFLADRLRKYNTRVYTLPNCIDFNELDRDGSNPGVISPLDQRCKKITLDEYRQRCQGKVVIGWLGSPTHKKDLQILVPVIKRITRQYKDRVMFVMGGCVHRDTAATTPYESIMFLEMVPPRTYMRYLAALDFDIGMAPVTDHLFNYSKSNLKVIEYMAAGFVPVASNLITYNTTIQNGKTGFLCRTPQEWMKTLRVLIESDALRGDIRERSGAYVRQKFDISTNAHKWADVYRSI